MNDPQANSPRARMQALLAIPERQRTDAEWDELNELEIMLASTNRQGAPEPGGRNNPQQGGGHNRPGGGQQPRQGGGAGGGGGGGQRHGQRPGRKFHQRPPKRGPGGPGGQR